MLKIKLKLNISNLNAVLHVLDSYDNEFKSDNFAFKAILSISDDLIVNYLEKRLQSVKTIKYLQSHSSIMKLMHLKPF